MSDRPLYFAAPHGDDSITGLVVGWPAIEKHQLSGSNQLVHPLVMVEDPEVPGAFTSPHVLQRHHLGGAYFSHDPETARTAVHLQQVAEFPDQTPDEEDDAA